MKDQHLGIDIDYSRDSKFDELGIKRLKESYMRDDETSPQQRYAFVSKQFGSNPEHAQRLYEYASKHWLSFSTPILSHGRSARGLGISCFLSYMHDSSAGLVDTLSETNWLSMMGGGVGVHLKIRSADEKSVGVMPHLKIYDASCLAYRQGRTRRGSYAMYMDISHPDIIQFLEIRKPTGDQNIRCMNLHHGINITDDFMQIIEKCMLDPKADDTWNLYDPYRPNVIISKVSAKDLWQKILELRVSTGEPYLHFIDTANRALPIWLQNLGLTINGSNLCAEIELPTSKDRTAVCCLSSLNLEYYDEWKDDYQFLRDVAEMLDNVLQFLIDNAPDTIIRAKYSASRERSIGVGVLGFHSYLQQQMIPWESAVAKAANLRIFKNIKKKLDRANKELGAERGTAPDAVGYGVRFSHTMAIAPTASSSIIMGNTSPSIEPMRANAYRQDTLSGAFLNKNKYLDRILKERCDEEQYNKAWQEIISDDGSAQGVKCLSDEEKDVFKTAMEIDQRWVIDFAADRAPLIDQGQSVNVFFRPDSNIKYIHAVHFMAWKHGVKALYYCRSDKLRKADKVSQQVERKIIEELDMTKVAEGDECLACGS
jgi:ribonucleoside-diphosphate reductase alpha chain